MGYHDVDQSGRDTLYIMIPAREMMLAQLGTKAADAIVRNPQVDRKQLAVTTLFAPKRFTSGEAGISSGIAARPDIAVENMMTLFAALSKLR